MTGRDAGTAPLAALPMPDRTSWFILVGLLVAVVALLWWCGRVVRRLGGPRRALRRARWEARMTGREVARPWRVRRRDRRRARTLAAFLAAPDARDTAVDALDRAERDAAGPCRAVAASLAPARDRVHVLLAGRDVPAPRAPWSATGAKEPWTWAAPLGKDGSVADGLLEAEAGRRLPLVLGVDRHGTGGVVVADWHAGPPVIAVEGDGPAARSVLQALTAQLGALPEGPPLLVAGGVHARFAGHPLPELLDGLEAADGDAEPPVLVCWAPDTAVAARLCALAERGAVRVLVGGTALPGHTWALHAEADGRLLSPELGADVEAAGLSRAVARALRTTARDGHRTPPPRPPADRPAPARTAAVPDTDALPAPRDGAAPVPSGTPDRDRTPPIPSELAEPAPASGRVPEPVVGEPVPGVSAAHGGSAADLMEPEPAPHPPAPDTADTADTADAADAAKATSGAGAGKATGITAPASPISPTSKATTPTPADFDDFAEPAPDPSPTPADRRARGVSAQPERNERHP
ncbi:hypothetical protein SLA_6951 [Streptomyces laurentii]|uniref:Uncharacterized protein n=1 Tax=Streptomyces laurentii TaxID=39478 RepID=A0A160P7B0_STRLU|nr:hypothetical protein SLA_6951 [Streptomyces laurentii]